MTRKINIANPFDKSGPHAAQYGHGSTLFAFGAYGSTFVLAYGYGLESRLEEAAEWLREHEPGHFVDDEYMAELYSEAVTEAGDPEPGTSEHDEATQAAETDLTYTESGWLPSWEWTIVFENPTKADLIGFSKGEP